MTEISNIAQLLTESALKYPDKRAVIYPAGRDRCGRVSYSHLTFSQLENLSNRYAQAFYDKGLRKGARVLVMLRPGLDFIAVAFAVFKTAAVPVLIDPGMGKKNLLKCIKETAPEAMITVTELLWAKKIFPSSFASVKTFFSLGKFPPPGVTPLESIAKDSANALAMTKAFTFRMDDVQKEDTAAILFTTGSTGPPKGVVYTHGIFMAQVRIITETYGSGPSETDMAAFPLFALFSAGMGMTCVIPDMDPTKPAKVNPQRIIEAVNNQGVSFSFGSPALWRTVATYCVKNNITLPSLKKVLMAGAPVNAELHALVKKIIAADGDTLVPYGATESLPVSSFSGSEMLAETAALTASGKGYCVGRPLNGITIKIIRTSEGPIEKWDEQLVLENGEIGEIVIKGPVVTPEYFNKPLATTAAKIPASDGLLWHRIGDVGYFDGKGRLWFCGRKAHRVVTRDKIYYTVCCEAIFNQHQDVFRSALVPVPAGNSFKPVMIIEPKPGRMPQGGVARKKFIAELLSLSNASELTADIAEILFHESFPVDIRHNAKIFREKLAVWASEKLT